MELESAHHTIIIGGGPIGTLTAAQLALECPGMRIRVYEKNAVYQRDHRLRLFSDIFAGMFPEKPESKLRTLCLSWAKAGSVETLEMEQKLRHIAEQAGVEFVQQKVEDPRELTTELDAAGWIIGADGSRSTTRHVIFEDKIEKVELQRIVQVQYYATTALTLDKLSWTAINGRLGALTHEQIDPPTEQGQRVTLRLFLSDRTEEAVWEQVSQASSKTPFALDERVPEKLRQKLQAWIDKRAASGADKFEKGEQPDVKLTAFALQTFLSDDVQRKEGGVTYALVGDAASTHSLQLGINEGIRQSALLVAEIAERWRSGERGLVEYGERVPQLYERFKAKAMKKNAQIQAGKKVSAAGKWASPNAGMRAYDTVTSWIGCIVNPLRKRK